MSPTEFSNYIKQRALQQQQMYSHALSPASPGGRSLSPHADYYFQQHSGGYPGTTGTTGAAAAAYRNMFQAANTTSDGPSYMPELYPKFPSYMDPPSQLFGSHHSGSGANGAGGSSPIASQSPMSHPSQQSSSDHYGVGSGYPASQYQHLLVAN